MVCTGKLRTEGKEVGTALMSLPSQFDINGEFQVYRPLHILPEKGQWILSSRLDLHIQTDAITCTHRYVCTSIHVH